MYAIQINPGLAKEILYGMWLQLIGGQPSPSDSASVTLSKILAIYGGKQIDPGQSESSLLWQILKVIPAGASSGIQSVVAGTNITVTGDLLNPTISSTL